METSTKKQYVIGEESELFLNALDVFSLFQTKFLEALEGMYGNEKGGQLFDSESQKFEDIERMVMEYLRINFTSQMGLEKDTITL